MSISNQIRLAAESKGYSQVMIFDMTACNDGFSVTGELKAWNTVRITEASTKEELLEKVLAL